MKEITIVVSDRVGLVADVAEALASKGINIDSVNFEKSGKNAIVRVVTSAENYVKARRALFASGFEPVNDKFLILNLPDRPGELARVSRKLAQNSINIENMFLLKRDKGKIIFSLKVDDFFS